MRSERIKPPTIRIEVSVQRKINKNFKTAANGLKVAYYHEKKHYFIACSDGFDCIM